MKKIFLFVVVFLMAAPVVFAQPYAPGSTLDPTCGPSVVNCYVQFATNGLTQSLSGIGLGGTLTGATTIDQNTNNLSFTNGNVGIGTAANASYGLVTLGTYLNTSSITTANGGNLQITNNEIPFFGNVANTVPFAGMRFEPTGTQNVQIDNGVVFSPLLNEVVGGMYSNDFTSNQSHAVEVYSRGARMASTDNANLTSTIEVGPTGATLSGRDLSLGLLGTLGLALNNNADKISFSYQNGATYSFPNSNGLAGRVMVNDGSNALGWKSIRQYADNPTGSPFVGPVATGVNAISIGSGPTLTDANSASGDYSVAIGTSNKSSANSSVAIGTLNTVSTNYGVAIGKSNTVSNPGAVALGMENIAFGSNAFATGYQTQAMQWGASSFGTFSKAWQAAAFAAGDTAVAGDSLTGKGFAAVAFGKSTLASEDYSMATGLTTRATAQAAFSGGKNTIASGDSSLAMGNSNTASGANAVALGLSNQATGARSFVFGNAISALASDEIVLGTVNTTYVPTGTSTDRRFTVATGSGGFPFDAFTILQNGKVGVGINNFETTSSGALLQVGSSTWTGDVARFQGSVASCLITNSGTTTCSSDERLKKEIADSSYGLVAINQLRPVTYLWKNQDNSVPKTIGFIAQEVERVIPEAVTTDSSTGYLSLNTGYIIPTLVKAVQELSQKIGDIANGITTRFLRTDTLCVGNACVTESEFLRMMQQSSVSTVVTNPVIPVIPDSNESTSTTTTGPVVDPIDTVAVTSEIVPADSAISTPEPVVN